MTASPLRLLTLLDGVQIGTLEREGNRLSFEYTAAWRQSPTAHPLSLSLPLARAVHDGPELRAYLWGLLPDNDRVLERWARRFQVSAGNVFALLAHVGEDCAGAVQFVRPQRTELLAAPHSSQVQWLDEADIATRLRALRADPASGRAATDTGSFSLAGAQPKTALLRLDGKWGVPSERVPTTHILKPPGPDFDGFAENEHFCLTLARRVGLAAARSEVEWFEDEPTIVVQRFDRVRLPTADGVDSLRRIHQEDLCQALGVHPGRKYQNEGGPSPADAAALLREHSLRPEQDIDTFVDALAFNWLIAGTDAHAKNYAVLHGAGGAVVLAPLYDLVSALPYPRQLEPQRIKLSMKIGSKYRVRDVRRRQWEQLAAELDRDVDATVARVQELARALPDLAADVRADLHAAGLASDVLDRLVDGIARHCATCVARLQA